MCGSTASKDSEASCHRDTGTAPAGTCNEVHTPSRVSASALDAALLVVIAAALALHCLS